MKNLYGLCAFWVGVCGLFTDIEVCRIAIKYPSGIVNVAAGAVFFAITAIIVALCCILLYLARHED